MKTKHTPGPWDWRNDINGGEYDLSPGILTTDLPDGTPWGDEIDRANARLIAAAPDLLAALKGAAMQLKAHKVSCRELDEARAAIAKATGEPQ